MTILVRFTRPPYEGKDDGVGEDNGKLKHTSQQVRRKHRRSTSVKRRTVKKEGINNKKEDVLSSSRTGCVDMSIIDSTGVGLEEIDDTTTCSAMLPATVDDSGLSLGLFEKDSHNLVGTLWSPTPPPHPSPSSSPSSLSSTSNKVVILCHGLMSDRESPLLKSIAYQLTTQLGLSTFRFDFSGNGESKGVWDYGAYNEEASELERAIEMLQDTRALSTIAIIGHSRGATVVCLHTANPHYTKVPLVVSLSGRYDMTNKPNRFSDSEKHELETIGYCDWVLPTRMNGKSKRRYRWKKDSIDKIMAMDTKNMTEECAKRASGSKMMFIGAMDDTAVPIRDLHSFQRVYNDAVKEGIHSRK
ncbi:hypothetical protein FOL47_011040 [Perkinsus chesapeaki]|uniref:Serine aminopeptidase S33 domain-containing protein n=1 Tax=Perkinsus chesapeaki TaxID=330153 RepID=A0A7J6L1H8_PERCH|nr:hypothetical protein FOL47_011040 [Perkinsus chesapeaki]